MNKHFKDGNSGDFGSKGQLKMHLSTKLLVFTISLLAVAVLALGIISINLGSSAITNQADADAQQYATEGASHVGAIITGNLSALSEVAARAGTTGMDWNTQIGTISGDVSRLGYQDIAVMNLSGHAKYVVGGGEFDSAGQFWYEGGFKGENVVSDVAISKVTLKPVVFDVAPIKSNGQVVGLLVGRRDPTFLKNTTNAMGDGVREYGFVVNATGGFMAHPDDQVVIDQINVFDEIENNGTWKNFGAALKALGTGKTDMISYELNGETKIGATAPIPGTNWTLIVAQYKSDVLAPMANLRNIVLLVSLFILLAGGATAFIMAKRIAKPVVRLKEAAERLALGDVEVEVEATTNDEIGELTIAFEKMVENRKLQAQVAQSLAEGDFKVEIKPQSDKDVLSYSMIAMVDELNKIYDGINETSAAAIEGRLDFRGDPDGYPGSFKDFIIDLNVVIDSFVKPLKVANKAIERIGNGRIPPKITTNYNGDFNDLKNNINSCIDGLGALTETKTVIHQLFINDFEARMEGNYLGIFGELAESVNEMQWKLNFILSIVNHVSIGEMTDYEELKKIGKRCDEDEFIPSLIKMIENIQSLVDEADEMAHIAVEGDLNHRGDPTKFTGEYAKVIEGFNQTLDVVIEPIKAASEALKELAKGNLKITMEGDFKGHHGKIKDDMNQTINFLNRYVTEITSTLERIGEGDLSQEITSYYHGDFVNIKLAINGITTHLSEVMSEIDVAANQVDSGARQISDAGQALAQGTTEQASSIEELTASIEEVAGETKRNAVNANQANERAIEVGKSAELGNNQMEEMVTAMIEINDSSKNISKIIKVIDDIAFQTNILALNAAVEAARAGQHGKGFAVVAEEVRSLAARSAEAARSTTDLIEGSISKAEYGTRIADETAESLKEILNQIEKVANLVSDIAQASNDQASEIAQITQGIEQVSQVVQTNSATAEESAAASEELSSQAEMLKQMVGSFKLKNDSGEVMNESLPLKSIEKNNSPSSAPRIVLDDMEMDKY